MNGGEKFLLYVLAIVVTFWGWKMVSFKQRLHALDGK